MVQPAVHETSDNLQPSIMDIVFQSPEAVQPAAQETPDNVQPNMDIDLNPIEVEQLTTPSGLGSLASESEAEQFHNDEGWTKSTIPIVDFNFDASSTGPKFDVNLIRTGMDIFKLVFMESLIDFITERTNKYGE